MALMLLAVGLSGCINSDGGSQQITAYDEDDGKTVNLKKNGTLNITLESNPSTGYAWVIVGNYSKAVLNEGANGSIPAEQAMPGAPGKQYFLLNAVGEGETTIFLEYKRSWETEPPAKIYSLTVVVEL